MRGTPSSPLYRTLVMWTIIGCGIKRVLIIIILRGDKMPCGFNFLYLYILPAQSTGEGQGDSSGNWTAGVEFLSAD
jgi:hypothetical protein